VALAAGPARQAVDILTQEGRLYSLKTQSAKSAVIESPSFSPRGNSTAILPAAAVSQDGHTLVWTEAKASGRAYIYDVVSGKTPRSVSLPGEAVAPAQSFAGGVLAPLGNGSVALVPLEGAASVSPFTPPLSPGELPRWTRPAVLASSFVVSDGRDMIYAVVRKDQPQAHLAAAGEKRTSGPIVSPLVAAGGTALGIVRLENADALAAFDGQGAAALEPIALEGRVEAGPYAIGGLVVVATEPGGLVCAEASGKIRWQRPLEGGPLAGPPLATASGELLVLYQSGAVCRLDATSGQSIARVTMDEPLGGAACIVGEQVFAATSGGAVLCFPLPARP
jgi:hypothetical protein